MTDFDNELKTGLWSKNGKDGKEYWSGKIKVNGKEYWINLFKTEEKYKKGDKPKEYSVKMNPVDGSVANNEKQPESDPYKDFGDSIEVDDEQDEQLEIEISDDDLPF